MTKLKPGERQRAPYLTDAGMYRKKPPRNKHAQQLADDKRKLLELLKQEAKAGRKKP
jgi:hypothetical protein